MQQYARLRAQREELNTFLVHDKEDMVYVPAQCYHLAVCVLQEMQAVQTQNENMNRTVRQLELQLQELRLDCEQRHRSAEEKTATLAQRLANMQKSHTKNVSCTKLHILHEIFVLIISCCVICLYLHGCYY